MARPASFNFRKTPKGWLVNIPGFASDTGRFRRRYFRTRDDAKDETKRIREISQGLRGKVVDIPPDVAADAVKARSLLAAHDVTLVQVASFYISHHDQRGRAPTLKDAWDTALTHRDNHRPRTKADMKAWKKALPAWFLDMNTHDIGAADITKALDETTSGQTRWKSGLRNISSVLGDVVRSGSIAKSPVTNLTIKRNPESHDDEVSIYSPEELGALLASCVDYPKGEEDRLCSGCAIPFAFMAFAGIRPDEVTKLHWEDVSTDLTNIRIGASVAKKARRRNVRINDTLAAWIATIPVDKRKGKLVPARWRYKAAKVRKKAEIDGREKQDALRHSFGSYLLASDNDINSLKADMGHEHVRVFFSHYHKAVTAAEAARYWAVWPIPAPSNVRTT